jgi:cytochrome b5
MQHHRTHIDCCLRSEMLDDAAAPQTDEQLPEYSLTEVAAHATPGDCWLVIYDRVYDVSEFADMHPGGAKLLHKYGGGVRNASKAFAVAKHSQKALELMALFCIGKLQVLQWW